MGSALPEGGPPDPVPAALLGAGCVAPEHRGSHLSTRLISERLRLLQDQGAVLATL
ncbi:hypothetical protein AB0C68_30530 [Streptomyces tendae]|uniref:hypothetical protein n=1 Tax=Streptomyces tendae TaxID=1932 RepID=UPI0033DC7E37